jgi:uncharacterized protein (DUF433 family)
VSIHKMTESDFEHARRKAFWRRVFSWIVGERNDLLPFDEVREKLPFRGQHYVGLRQVPIDLIIGSSGRYRDFDRAFLPIQSRTRNRWLSIDQAHYEEINLPPVELYKMGDIYFVKDGNHRVSVARERGQEFIDAIVTEIVVPFSLTPDTDIAALVLQSEQLEFFETTRLDQLRPETNIHASIEGEYRELLEHIEVHRWYLGEQKRSEATYEEAVISWYDAVYLPIVEVLRENNLLEDYPHLTETDLYLWIIKYLYYLRQAYRGEGTSDQPATATPAKKIKEQAAKQVMEEYPQAPLAKLASALRSADWLDKLILNQERSGFLQKTRLHEYFPDAALETTVPSQYEKLLEHINVHRWYLGEQNKRDISYEEAVKSWYQNVYYPLVKMIREQEILEDFPGRTETDLYLWIISHQWYLRESLGGEVTVEQVVEELADAYSQYPGENILDVLKKSSKKEE